MLLTEVAGGMTHIFCKYRLNFPYVLKFLGQRKQIITLCRSVKSQQHTFNIQPTVFPKKKGPRLPKNQKSIPIKR